MSEEFVFIPDRPMQMRATDKDLQESKDWDKRRKSYKDYIKMHVDGNKEKISHLRALKGKFKQMYAFWKKTALALRAKVIELNIEHAKEIAVLKKDIRRLKRELRDKSKAYTRRKNMVLLYKNNSRKRTIKYKLIERQLAYMTKNHRFFTKTFNWKMKCFNAGNYGEVMIRAIIAYEQLREQEIVTKMEMVILITGLHLETFRRSDVEYRFGVDNAIGWDKVVAYMVKAKYIKKVMRLNLYHLTDDGRTRIETILKTINKVPYRNYYPPVL
ncbi:MAG: hypothetical protein JWQ09_5894 [Segetibacter sp.]|nr:hypothetical protein [Segetibacter sp.]